MVREATAYKPYRPLPQILTLQTPNGLPGVQISKDGDYKMQTVSGGAVGWDPIWSAESMCREFKVNPADYDRMDFR